MGQTHNNVQLHNYPQLKLFSQYTVSKTIQTKIPTPTVLLNHNKTFQPFLLRELTYIEAQSYIRQLQNFRRKKLNVKENVLNLIQVEGIANRSFCSDSYKIYLLYEYSDITLAEQIEARKNDEGQMRYFDQQDLWSIIQSCLNGLQQIYSENTNHTFRRLNPTQIYIKGDGIIKILDHQQIMQNYGTKGTEVLIPVKVDNNAQEDDQFAFDNSHYYSPQYFSRNSRYLIQQKQVVYSLGMTLLHTGLLQDCHDCYDEQSLRNDRVLNKIKRLQELYSSDLIKLVEGMLSENKLQRLGLGEVQQIICIKSGDEQQNSHLTEQHEVENQERLDVQMEQKQNDSAGKCYKQIYKQIINDWNYQQHQQKNQQFEQLKQIQNQQSQNSNLQNQSIINQQLTKKSNTSSVLLQMPKPVPSSQRVSYQNSKAFLKKAPQNQLNKQNMRFEQEHNQADLQDAYIVRQSFTSRNYNNINAHNDNSINMNTYNRQSYLYPKQIKDNFNGSNNSQIIWRQSQINNNNNHSRYFISNSQISPNISSAYYLNNTLPYSSHIFNQNNLNGNLFTDPKLIQMMRKDLTQINARKSLYGDSGLSSNRLSYYTYNNNTNNYSQRNYGQQSKNSSLLRDGLSSRIRG